jgi:hypothetical protein
MDAAVVLLGVLDATNVGSYTALRAVRVLRPLRTITRIEGLKVGLSSCPRVEQAAQQQCQQKRGSWCTTCSSTMTNRRSTTCKLLHWVCLQYRPAAACHWTTHTSHLPRLTCMPVHACAAAAAAAAV